MVQRGIHGEVDTCQIDYSIHFKLRIFHCSEVVHANFLFFFHFLHFNVPDNKCHKQKSSATSRCLNGMGTKKNVPKKVLATLFAHIFHVKTKLNIL